MCACDGFCLQEVLMKRDRSLEEQSPEELLGKLSEEPLEELSEESLEELSGEALESSGTSGGLSSPDM